ncbi:hypothetical protein G6F24_013698 [Rhizopus arrhizus]|nr:hypothetical protein G6F24_013698 [Rhizopus arrhizus]
MGVIAETADRVAVMYAGRIVEIGPVLDVLRRPGHPYTQGLMNAIPGLRQRAARLNQIDGAMPRLHAMPDGWAPARRGPRPPQAQPSATAGCIKEESLMPRNDDLLLRAEDLACWFDVSPPWLERTLSRQPEQTLKAVDGVSLAVPRGTTLSIVGESGCGKSTLGRGVAGLHRQTEGELRYLGQDAVRLRGAEKLAYTLGVQMIFQDPQASLNPRQRLRQILGESLKVHKLAPPAEIPGRIDQALKEVGLDA